MPFGWSSRNKAGWIWSQKAYPADLASSNSSIPSQLIQSNCWGWQRMRPLDRYWLSKKVKVHKPFYISPWHLTRESWDGAMVIGQGRVTSRHGDVPLLLNLHVSSTHSHNFQDEFDTIFYLAIAKTGTFIFSFCFARKFGQKFDVKN